MAKLTIRCRECNQYVEFKTDDDNYFRYVTTNNPAELKLNETETALVRECKCRDCHEKGARLNE